MILPFFFFLHQGRPDGEDVEAADHPGGSGAHRAHPAGTDLHPDLAQEGAAGEETLRLNI